MRIYQLKRIQNPQNFIKISSCRSRISNNKPYFFSGSIINKERTVAVAEAFG
jgi:hypothetical protein